MKQAIYVLVLFFFICCLPLVAGENPAPGIKVGSKAPAATFVDQFGKKVTLKELTKKGPVALVFHRSARW